MIEKLLDMEIKINNLLSHAFFRHADRMPIYIAYRTPRILFENLIQYFDNQNVTVIKDNKILSIQDVLDLFTEYDLERCESDLMYRVYLFRIGLFSKSTWNSLSVDERAEMIGYSDYVLNRDLKSLVIFFLPS